MASAVEQLQGYAGMASALSGLFGGDKTREATTTTSGRTTTRGKDISEAGIQNIIDRMMAGPGGVKDVSGAARGAGLYNASTEKLMRDSLAARVAGEAAERSAKEIVEEGPQTIIQTALEGQTGIGPLGSMAAIGGMKLLGSGIDKLLDGGLGGIGDSIGSLLGIGSSGVSQVGSLASGGSLGLSLPTTASSISGGTLGLGGSAAGFGPSLSDFTGFQDAGMALGDVGATGVAGAASNVGSLGEFASNFSNMPLTTFANPVLSLLGGVLGGEDSLNPVSMGMSALGSGIALMPTMGPLSLAVGPVMQGLGSLFGDMSIICTALKKRGLLDPIQYAMGQEYISTMHNWTIKGYYLWGTPVAGMIDKGSAWAIALCLPWAESRMQLLAAKSGLAKYFRWPLGTITQFIGQPLCFILGALVTLSEGISHGYRTR